MEEKDTLTVETAENENTTVEEGTEQTAATATVEEKKPSPFAGMKDQKGLKAKIKYFFEILEKYPDVRQMVLFVLFSFLCGFGQLVTTLVLENTVKFAPGMGEPFQAVPMGGFYLFDFTTKAALVGFLCGATVGQVLTFILNRKKTFRATNNVVVSAVMYAIIAVLITLLQTLIGGWIPVACQNAHPVNGETFGEKILALLYSLAGLSVGGITALVLSFLGNKFLVMRDWGKKKTEEK